MTNYLIQNAFSTGVISPTLAGRTDLEKYDLALKEAINWYVDYRGGISTRPGTEYIGPVKTDTKQTRFVKFSFSPDTANTYVLLFGDLYIRFLQDGGYVLESAKTITGITQANPGVVTCTAHGWSNGDWVFLTGVGGMGTRVYGYYQVASATTNTFELNDVYGNAIDTTGFPAFTSGGTAARVYEVTSPYAAADLARLKVHQIRDQLTITHVDYAPRTLTRTAATSWTLAEIDFTVPGTAPTNVAVDAGAGSAGVGFAVTVVTDDGESLPSRIDFDTTAVNYAVTTGSAEVTWDADPAATFYNIYRTLIVPTGSEVSHGMELGYIGQSYGPQFVDNNIVPDFSSAPPINRQPFADGAIDEITITAGGSGYTHNSATVSVSGGGGTGFVGYPILSGGAVVGVRVVDPGSGYSSPTVTFGGSGTGATGTATATATGGNFPAVSTLFQQRRLYAGTANFPMTVFGSRPNQYTNFASTDRVVASDAYEYTLDAEEVAPIRHLVPVVGGLLIFTQGGVFLLTAPEGRAVSATEALSDPQSSTGVSVVDPLHIDNDVLFTQEKGAAVRALAFSDALQSFQPEDVSILSNHFFTRLDRILFWSYAEDPSKVVWAVKTKGTLLSLTYVPDQKVTAWCEHQTQGLFRDVLVVEEDNVDVPYLVVERFINGRWSKFVERMKDRRFTAVEEYWGSDCALANTSTYPAADLTIAAATGTGVTVTASTSVFVSGDVGKVLRAGGGRMVVASFVSGTEITVDILRDILDIVPQSTSGMPVPISSGDWTLNATFTTVTGLRHLEGESVIALADGNVIGPYTVTDGEITLDRASSLVTVGFSYNCDAKSLPLTSPNAVIEGRRKRIIGTAIRLNETRGLVVGAEGGTLYSMKDRTTEGYGIETRTRSDISFQLVEATWTENESLHFRQAFPLPATILGLVYDVDIGDDNL